MMLGFCDKSGIDETFDLPKSILALEAFDFPLQRLRLAFRVE